MENNEPTPQELADAEKTLAELAQTEPEWHALVAKLQAERATLTDPVSIYIVNMIEIARLFTPQEELELIREARNDNQEARQRWLEAYLIFTVRLAQRFQSAKPEFPLLEVIQEANLGLIEASSDYNIASAYSFQVYVTYWVNRRLGQMNFEEITDRMLRPSMFQRARWEYTSEGRSLLHFIDEYMVWLKEQGHQKVAEYVDTASKNSNHWKVLEEIAETAAKNPNMSREEIRTLFTQVIPKIKGLSDEPFQE